jgi:hypothetical protein
LNSVETGPERNVFINSTSGCLSVGIVRSRTQTMEFVFVVLSRVKAEFTIVGLRTIET